MRACVADAADGDMRARPRAGAQSKLAIDESESAQLKRAKESYERHAERVGRGSLGRGAADREVCGMQARGARGGLGEPGRAARAWRSCADAQAERGEDGAADGVTVGRADAGVAYQCSGRL